MREAVVFVNLRFVVTRSAKCVECDMDKHAAIGVFDSGLGGISVLHEIRGLLPSESFIYIADSAHVPYGEKAPEFIVQRSIAITEFLLAQPVKAIVVACNTATARSEEHTSELQSRPHLVCRLLLEKKKKK